MMKTFLLRTVAVTVIGVPFLAAQPADDTKLRQVIIFGRHSVRASLAPNSYLDSYSVRPYPVFSVAPGMLTANGAKLETILGGYYRLWLTREGLLTGNDAADAPWVYFRANAMERTRTTAQALAAGMLPAAAINVNSYADGASDPLFDAVGAGVARLDQAKAIAAVTGRLGGNSNSLAAAYGAELALTRSLLFGYPAGQTPAPVTPAGITDVTTLPIEITAGTAGTAVHLGGLEAVLLSTDPFIMQYAEGMPLSDVGWGQLGSGGVSQILRLYNLILDLGYRTPYVASVQSSNVASHIVRSMLQASTGNNIAGALGSPATKVITLIASDVNITGLAGLFHLDWLVPGYQPDYCGPGGAWCSNCGSRTAPASTSSAPVTGRKRWTSCATAAR